MKILSLHSEIQKQTSSKSCSRFILELCWIDYQSENQSICEFLDRYNMQLVDFSTSIDLQLKGCISTSMSPNTWAWPNKFSYLIYYQNNWYIMKYWEYKRRCYNFPPPKKKGLVINGLKNVVLKIKKGIKYSLLYLYYLFHDVLIINLMKCDTKLLNGFFARHSRIILKSFKLIFKFSKHG